MNLTNYNVCRLNAEAVESMRRNELRSAMANFRNALKQVMMLLQNCLDATTNLEEFSVVPVQVIPIAENNLTITAEADSEVNHQTLKLYKRAFLLTESTNPVPSCHLETMCIIVLYNMGLGYHLLALQESCLNFQKRNLVKALGLYHRASSMLNRIQSGHEGFCNLCAMALWNNMGNICMCLCLKHEAEHCLTSLSQQLGQSAASLDVIDSTGESYDHFYQNVLLLITGFRHRHAPAA